MAEFIGTFFLVFTVGCNVAAVGEAHSQGVFVAISIGSVLMITIYGLGLSRSYLFFFERHYFTFRKFRNVALLTSTCYIVNLDSSGSVVTKCVALVRAMNDICLYYSLPFLI
jgi:hypothetical protein